MSGERTASRFPEAVLQKKLQGVEMRLLARIEDLEARLQKIEGKRNAA